MSAHGSSASRLRPGQILTVTVEKGVYRGQGLARQEGQVLFVPRGLPGDRVRVRLQTVRAGYAEAVVEEIVAPSPSRRPAPCPYAAECGGCAYQELAYEEQVKLKEEILGESLRRAGVSWDGPVPFVASPERGWRMRAALHVGRSEGRLTLGLHREGSRRVVDIESCLQMSSALNETARALLAAVARRPALAPRLRGVELLESPDGATRAAVVGGRIRPHEAPALASPLRDVPGLTGAGVLCDDGSLHWLHGTPHVEAPLLGLVLRAHVRSFFQANRFLYEELASCVLDLLPLGGRVLDLYAGVGLFAIPAAARGADEVIAVEVSPTAAEDARAGARRAGLDQVRVRRGPVLEALTGLRLVPGERIVLDPPRTGAGAEVVDAVAGRRPDTIVYVSCDPPTLGRDLARFARLGYRPDAIRGLDLFPDTFHLETIVRLRPA